MDYTVYGILQARVLEWVVFPFSMGIFPTGIESRSPALQADSLPAGLRAEELMLLNWVFEETLESPLDSKKIQPVIRKGNQLRMFTGRTDAEAEAAKLGVLQSMGLQSIFQGLETEQWTAMAYMAKESKKEWLHVYV